MEIKRYIDIEHARFEDTEFKKSNTGAFHVGDLIQITEKIDGSNASIAWDTDEYGIKVFSRNKELTYSNTLRGFWNYIQQKLPQQIEDWLKEHPNYVMFGEWGLNGNKIKTYDKKYVEEWIIYDIYDKETQTYLPQEQVKSFVIFNPPLQYIHVLYSGEFISWEHVKNFLHENTYGQEQEGIVIKNQSRLTEDSREPKYLKIVNETFKESMRTRVKKEKSPNDLAEKARVSAIVESIVTQRRVEKGIEKLRDEGVLPEKLTPQDMGLVAKTLNKVVHDDCVKEEYEKVVSAGEKFTKMCNSRTMMIARKLICG